jgi:hypothetical protein
MGWSKRGLEMLCALDGGWVTSGVWDVGLELLRYIRIGDVEEP